MTTRVEFQPAFLLHSQSYRDSSLLADLFTQDHGRIRVVIKGARQAKSRYRGIRPFLPLLISYQGRTDLFTLTDMEINGELYSLMHEILFCGFYLNELLMRLLADQDACSELFHFYQETLIQLSQESVLGEVEPLLRHFEFFMLKTLGYGFALDVTEDERPISSDKTYQFDPKKGFSEAEFGIMGLFKGKHLLDFQSNQWSESETRSAIKRLMQLALAPLLGNRPLKSRNFFRQI